MVDKFKKKFFANSAEKLRSCKPNEAIKLARQAAGTNQPLPLSRDTVEGVATALKEAGLKSGQQYMTDLKLMYMKLVSICFDVEAWLKRSFEERERGPVTRAMEVKVDTVPRLELLGCPG